LARNPQFFNYLFFSQKNTRCSTKAKVPELRKTDFGKPPIDVPLFCTVSNSTNDLAILSPADCGTVNQNMQMPIFYLVAFSASYMKWVEFTDAMAQQVSQLQKYLFLLLWTGLMLLYTSTLW
jgi:hypothetical protein